MRWLAWSGRERASDSLASSNSPVALLLVEADNFLFYNTGHFTQMSDGQQRPGGQHAILLGARDPRRRHITAFFGAQALLSRDENEIAIFALGRRAAQRQVADILDAVVQFHPRTVGNITVEYKKLQRQAIPRMLEAKAQTRYEKRDERRALHSSSRKPSSKLGNKRK